MTLGFLVASGVDFLSSVYVRIYDTATYDCVVNKPLSCAKELYDLRILSIYRDGEDIVIELEEEE